MHSAADFKGKTLGVTDLGSGTDELTQFLASKQGVTHSEYQTVAVGAGATAIAAIQRNSAQCVMTTQPTVGALESKKSAYRPSTWPPRRVRRRLSAAPGRRPGVLANAELGEVAPGRGAGVSSTRWSPPCTGSAPTAPPTSPNKLPPQFVSNNTISKQQYIAGLTTDKGQFLPDGIMPAGGPKTIYAMEKTLGVDVSKVTLATPSRTRTP